MNTIDEQLDDIHTNVEWLEARKRVFVRALEANVPWMRERATLRLREIHLRMQAEGRNLKRLFERHAAEF